MNLFIEVCYPIKQVHCELLSWLLLTFEGIIIYSFVFYNSLFHIKRKYGMNVKIFLNSLVFPMELMF